MKRLLLLLCLFLLFSCNPGQPEQKETSKEDSSIKVTVKPAGASDSAALMNLSTQILQLVKDKRWNDITAFVHPVKGISFAPYSYTDSAELKHFTKAEFEAAASSKKKINWGNTFSDDEFAGTIDQYASRFVYDADFLHAPEQSFNRIIMGATAAVNNVKASFPHATFTEFYFPGFDKKSEGMDWRALYLLYEKEDGQYYLTGIVHDGWTP